MPSRPGHRLWYPAIVVALVATVIAVVHLQPELERNRQAWVTAAVVLLGLLLTLIWFLFLSRIPWRIRGIGILVLALVGVGLSQTVRVAGAADGRGLPTFAWRWNIKHEALPSAIQRAPETGAMEAVPGLSDVPQFFGPNRDGVVRGAKLARDWKAHPPKELWRHPVGAAWSAFAVSGRRAFTQEQRGENEAVTCYDVLTGGLLWIHTYPAKFYQWQGGEGPRATPTVDRGRVFTYGGTGILTCLDAATGQQIWTRNVLQENHLENLIWGTSSSPLVYDDIVVVTGGANSGPTLLAYHRETGAPLWKSGTDKASYASPVLATLCGRRVILSVDAANLTGYDPQTGSVVLEFRWSQDNWPKAAQPAVLPGDRVFISAGYGIGAQLLEIKPAADGRLAATTTWKSVRMKTQFNSAIPREGYLYGLDDGLLACLDVSNGDRKWKDGRFGSGQTLVVDDLVIVQSEPGEVILAAAQPDGYQELGHVAALSSKTWNHPTLAGRYLLVRNDQEAVCYELPVEGQ